MTTFNSEVELDVVVDQSSQRDSRASVEDALADVPVGVGAGLVSFLQNFEFEPPEIPSIDVPPALDPVDVPVPGPLDPVDVPVPGALNPVEVPVPDLLAPVDIPKPD